MYPVDLMKVWFWLTNVEQALIVTRRGCKSSIHLLAQSIPVYQMPSQQLQEQKVEDRYGGECQASFSAQVCDVQGTSIQAFTNIRSCPRGLFCDLRNYQARNGR